MRPEHDPLAGLAVTDGFRRIGAEIARLGLPTVFVQEGGYLSDILGANLTAVLSGFEEACDSSRSSALRHTVARRIAFRIRLLPARNLMVAHPSHAADGKRRRPSLNGGTGLNCLPEEARRSSYK